MSSVQLATLADGIADISADTLTALRGQLRGSLLTADDPGYDEARSVWNAMIDKRPGLIVRCAGVADVLAAIRFARDHRLLISVKGPDTTSPGAPSATAA